MSIVISSRSGVVMGNPSGLVVEAGQLKRAHALHRRQRAVGHLGGQLVKQTHKFFGSEKQFASTRGIHIADRLTSRLEQLPGRVTLLTDATVLGIYEDGVVTADISGTVQKFRPSAVIVATGAYEKTLAFPGNDLPGVYGAGAVQTLMNEYGILPGRRVLMVGAGNIGLIVSYQLMQAGVRVAAILDAAPKIGGYLVHAAKIARMGHRIHEVPISYAPRAEKKLSPWRDGWPAVLALLRYLRWKPAE